MLKKFTRRPLNEEGMSIVEVIVASAILVIVLTSSALAITNAMSTATVSSQRNEAAQFAQDIISVAKQAPFARLALREGGPLVADPGCEAQPALFNNKAELTQTEEYPDLVYCQFKTITGTNFEYKIYTDITAVDFSDFDNTTANLTSYDVQGLTPVRVTVTVMWGNDNKLVSSYVRTPTLAECMPYDVSTDGVLPAVCVRGVL